MTFSKKKENNTIFDIVVVGAGSIGIAFACGFSDTNIKIAVIDKLPKAAIEKTQKDGS